MVYAIELYNLCKEFRVLPGAGGLFDQPYDQVLLLQAASAAFARYQDEKLKEAENKRKRRSPR